MRAVHHLALVDLGHTASQIEAVTSEAATSFNKLHKTVLPTLLGGDWSSKSSASVVFARDLYGARNQIAHAGRALTRQDADAASAAYDGIVELIIARLLHKPSRYPRTALALLGRPGLERRGRWSGYFERYVASVADEPDSFWLPFDAREAPCLSALLFRNEVGVWGWYVIDRAWRLGAAISEPEGLDEAEREYLTSATARVDADLPNGPKSIEVTGVQTTPPRGPVWFPIARLAPGTDHPAPSATELAYHPRLKD